MPLRKDGSEYAKAAKTYTSAVPNKEVVTWDYTTAWKQVGAAPCYDQSALAVTRAWYLIYQDTLEVSDMRAILLKVCSFTSCGGRVVAMLTHRHVCRSNPRSAWVLMQVSAKCTFLWVLCLGKTTLSSRTTPSECVACLHSMSVCGAPVTQTSLSRCARCDGGTRSVRAIRKRARVPALARLNCRWS